jgi:hypothetical protein
MSDVELINGQRVVWKPTPRQAQFLACPAREACYGGSLGGGKSDSLIACGLSQIAHGKHRALFLRRSFPQLRSAIERSHELCKPLGGVFHIQTSTWSFGSGAKFEFAFLDSDSDQWRYAGRNFNCILWDELCEWPTDSAYVYLLSRLRTTKGSGLRLEVRSSANPLGPGATWVRQRFNIPDDGGPSECTDPDTKFRRVFFPARISDNVHLEGSDYVRQLQALPPAKRKALLDGRWDCVSGACFEEFSHEKHVCDPFPIPANWELWRGADDGYNCQAAVLWLTQNPDTGAIFVIREIYAAKQLPEELSERILQIDYDIPLFYGPGDVEPNDEPLTGVIDSAAFSDIGTGRPSRGKQMNDAGCAWQPVEKFSGSRVAGWEAIHRALGPLKDGQPGLRIFRGCKNLIRTLPALTFSPTNPEDVDENCEAHAPDALRYALTRRQRLFWRAKVRGL